MVVAGGATSATLSCLRSRRRRERGKGPFSRTSELSASVKGEGVKKERIKEGKKDRKKAVSDAFFNAKAILTALPPFVK